MSLNLDAWKRELRRIQYPAQMQMVDRGIGGQGYYPGAQQCLFGDFASPRVMILGRDFGTKDYYDKIASQSGRSEFSLTWRNTDNLYLPVLRNMRVLCTNYLMGVRMDGSAIGDIRDRLSTKDWQAYESSCWNFLCFQLDQFKPHAVLVCGADNRRDLERENHLVGTKLEVIYGPHPHSAIGIRNRKRHHEILDKVLHRVKLSIT